MSVRSNAANRFASRAEAEHYAGLMADALRTQQVIWLGQGTGRTFRSGTWFALTNAPTEGERPPAELLLGSVQHAGKNNLPAAVIDGIDARLGPAPAVPEDALAPWPVEAAHRWRAVLARAEAVSYANRLTAVPREQAWRPILSDDTGARLNLRPTAPGYPNLRS